MSNSVRYDLLKLLKNDSIAFNAAIKFVADDNVKYKAFSDAYAETAGPTPQTDNVQARTQEAIGLAEGRWSVISPE